MMKSISDELQNEIKLLVAKISAGIGGFGVIPAIGNYDGISEEDGEQAILNLIERQQPKHVSIDGVDYMPCNECTEDIEQIRKDEIEGGMNNLEEIFDDMSDEAFKTNYVNAKSQIQQLVRESLPKLQIVILDYTDDGIQFCQVCGVDTDEDETCHCSIRNQAIKDMENNLKEKGLLGKS